MPTKPGDTAPVARIATGVFFFWGTGTVLVRDAVWFAHNIYEQQYPTQSCLLASAYIRNDLKTKSDPLQSFLRNAGAAERWREKDIQRLLDIRFNTFSTAFSAVRCITGFIDNDYINRVYPDLAKDISS